MWVRGRSKVTIVKNHGTEIFADMIASDLLGDEEFAAYSHRSHGIDLALALPATTSHHLLITITPGPYVEELSASEVARVPGISVEAVKSRLHRARRALREQMAPLLGIKEKPGLVMSTACPDVLTMFSRHLEGEIDPDTCKKMESHLAGCASCRNACDFLKKTLALCRNSASVSVPVDVQESVRKAIRVFLSSKL